MLGFAVTLAPVLADKSVLGDHVYVVAPVAVKVLLSPVHKAIPLATTVGNTFTIIALVVLVQPVALVKVNVAVPAETPVITPAFEIVAIEGLELTHVPAVVGLAVIVAPLHTLESETETIGLVQHSASFKLLSADVPTVCPLTPALIGKLDRLNQNF